MSRAGKSSGAGQEDETSSYLALALFARAESGLATGLSAGTLHRLLELRPGGKAGKDAAHSLAADLVVVDEVSMLDVLLANQLVKAVAPGSHLLLAGDPDQ